MLIPLVGHKKPEVANPALGALMRLTGQDCGHNPKRWTEWWVEHSDEARERWLIDGLRRTEQILRVISDEELAPFVWSHLSFRSRGGTQRAGSFDLAAGRAGGRAKNATDIQDAPR